MHHKSLSVFASIDCLRPLKLLSLLPPCSRRSPARCWCRPTWATSGAPRASTCRRRAWAPPSTWRWSARPAPPPRPSPAAPAPARCTTSSAAPRARTGQRSPERSTFILNSYIFIQKKILLIQLLYQNNSKKVQFQNVYMRFFDNNKTNCGWIGKSEKVTKLSTLSWGIFGTKNVLNSDSKH